MIHNWARPKTRREEGRRQRNEVGRSAREHRHPSAIGARGVQLGSHQSGPAAEKGAGIVGHGDARDGLAGERDVAVESNLGCLPALDDGEEAGDATCVFDEATRDG